MRSIALAILVTASFLAAQPLAAVGVAQDAPGGLPEGCARVDAFTVTCEWVADVGPVEGKFARDITNLGRSVARVQMEVDPAMNFGFSIWDDEGRAHAWGLSRGSPIDVLAMLDIRPGRTYTFEATTTGGRSASGTSLPDVPGTLTISLSATSAVGTIIPSEYAGTPQDPQLVDGHGDAAEPHLDITAGWLDDPVLDDGVIQAGLVVPSLRDVQIDSYERARWDLEWTVMGERYVLAFVYFDEASPHQHLIVNGRGWSFFLAKYATGSVTTLLAGSPQVDAVNGTIMAGIPLAALGEPPEGAPFTNLTARSLVGPPTTPTSPGGTTPGNAVGGVDADTATENTRAFAVGGPDVWRQLRGDVSLEPAGVATLPWYRDPLSSANLPDTLQVLGALVAVTTALVGLLLVRRQREKLARLLDEIDAVVRAHAGDADAAVAGLEQLQHRFDGMLRKGHISESQHATLQARVEGAMGRLVLQSRAT